MREFSLDLDKITKTIFFCKKVFVSTCLHCFNAATPLTCICKGYLVFIFVFLPGFIYFLKSLLIRTKCMMIGHSGSSSFSKIYTSKISSVSLYLSTLMCGKLRCSALAHSSASINSLKWIWNCLEWHFFDKKYEIMGQII